MQRKDFQSAHTLCLILSNKSYLLLPNQLRLNFNQISQKCTLFWFDGEWTVFKFLPQNETCIVDDFFKDVRKVISK